MTEEDTVQLAQWRLEAAQNGFAFVRNIACAPAPGDIHTRRLWWTPTGYVLTSASLRRAPNGDEMVHETFAFTADARGTITDWMELPGSTHQVLDHELVIKLVVSLREGSQ